jgi:putative ABC transport system ATP-binding protein
MIELNDVRFRWHPQGPLVLNIEKFKVNTGERVFIQGKSGSGKSTLLSMLGGIIIPETGLVKVNGTNFAQLKSKERDAFRADHIGIIFQLFNLIPYLSPIENTTLPCRFSKNRETVAIGKSNSVDGEARRLLLQLHLQDEATINSPAFKLSIGQQQRVAAARSLIGSPQLIIADEPTSALDFDVRDTFMNLLFNEIATAGATLIFVSHDPNLANHFDRHIKISDINLATD